MIIAIVNQKGGVGKTTVAANLAAALAASVAGGRVLLVDLDAQANATTLLGVPKSPETVYDALVNSESISLESVIVQSAAPGVDVAPGHLSLAGLESALQHVMGREMLLRELLEPLKSRYSAILIDNGPSLGIGPAMSLSAADIALVPAACEPMAMPGLQQITHTIDQARRRLNPQLARRIVLTMVDGRTSHARPIADTIRENYGREVYQTEIGISAELKRGLNNRALGGAIVAYAPASAPAKWFMDLALELGRDGAEAAHG